MLRVYLVEASGWINGELIHLVSDFHNSIDECYDDIMDNFIDTSEIYFNEFCYYEAICCYLNIGVMLVLLQK